MFLNVMCCNTSINKNSSMTFRSQRPIDWWLLTSNHDEALLQLHLQKQKPQDSSPSQTLTKTKPQKKKKILTATLKKEEITWKFENWNSVADHFTLNLPSNTLQWQRHVVRTNTLCGAFSRSEKCACACVRMCTWMGAHVGACQTLRLVH